MVDCDGAIAASIEADFRGWRVWRSDDIARMPCAWYATRHGFLDDVELYNGLFRTVGADNPAALRKELLEQAHAEAILEDKRRDGIELDAGPAVFRVAA